MQQINDAHIKEIIMLKNDFEKEVKAGQEKENMKSKIGTHIFDTDSEISLVKAWIDKKNPDSFDLRFFYRGREKLFKSSSNKNLCINQACFTELKLSTQSTSGKPLQ